MSYEIKGKVEKVLELQEFPSGFYKQTLVIKTGDKFPQLIPIEFAKEKTELLNGLGPGNEVTVMFDLRGREWNGKYYPDINGWKIERPENSGAPVQKKEPEPAEDLELVEEEDEDDIPF